MSLRRATVVIQAPGLSGTPFSGQLDTAEVNASCMASSARSKEPESRINVAMIRPDSCRKTDSTKAVASAIKALVLAIHLPAHCSVSYLTEVAYWPLAGCSALTGSARIGRTSMHPRPLQQLTGILDAQLMASSRSLQSRM